MIVNQPLNVVDADGGYEIMATVKGGGLIRSGRSFKTWYKQSFKFV